MCFNKALSLRMSGQLQTQRSDTLHSLNRDKRKTAHHCFDEKGCKMNKRFKRIQISLQKTCVYMHVSVYAFTNVFYEPYIPLLQTNYHEQLSQTK